MRNRLLAARMTYLVSAIRTLRNMVSTREMSSNPSLLKQFELIEWQISKMEDIYAEAKKDRSAS